MNSSTTSTASALRKVKPFRAPSRAFGSPFKVSGLFWHTANRFSLFVGSSPTRGPSRDCTVKLFKALGERSRNRRSVSLATVVISALTRNRNLAQIVRLNCPPPALPVSDSELDGLVRGMAGLTLVDDPMRASLLADDGFDISTAAAPYCTSSTLDVSYAISPTDGKVGKEKETLFEAEKEDVAVVSGQGPPSGSLRCTNDASRKNLVSAYCSPPCRPIHTTPLRSRIPGATTAPATDPLSASPARLTAIAVSLVYEVFASTDDETDEMQTWYPIGGGSLNVAATGRGLTLGATVEV